MAPWTRKDITRIEVTAQALNPFLTWATITEPAELPNSDPLAPLRRVCPPRFFSERRAWRKGARYQQKATNRPHFYGVATFKPGPEFDAFIDALNECPLYSLMIEVWRGGLFQDMGSFAESLVHRLRMPMRRLMLTSARNAFPLPPGYGHRTQCPWPAAEDLIRQGFVPPRLHVIQNGEYHFLWRAEPPRVRTRKEIMRSLSIARVLLLAKPCAGRTSFGDLPTEIIHDILLLAAQDPEALTRREWAVVLGHAEHRDGLTAVAKEVARINNVRQQCSPYDNPDTEPDYFLGPNVGSNYIHIGVQWLYNGGFWARVDAEKTLGLMAFGDMNTRWNYPA